VIDRSRRRRRTMENQTVEGGEYLFQEVLVMGRIRVLLHSKLGYALGVAAGDQGLHPFLIGVYD